MRALTPESKASIDTMPVIDMLSRWRFAPIGAFQTGDPYSDYFQKVMQEKRAENPGEWVRASKALS